VLYDGKQLSPGGGAFAQLHLAAPTLLVPRDRFIMRQFSPVVTIGGGVVLENAPPKRFLNAQTRCDFLELLIDGSRQSVLGARVTERGVHGLKISEAVARTGWAADDVASLAREIEKIQNVNGILIQNFALDMVRKSLLKTVASFQKENPLAGGVTKENLRERLAGVEPEVFEAVLQEKLKAGEIELTGELVRLPGQGASLSSEETESRELIERAFASAGLKVPALKDVLAGLKIDKMRAQKIVTLLLRNKILIKISEDLVFHHAALEELREKLAAERTKSPKFDVAAFKELTGVSRKYAIPLLEYLDRERVTKRVGDERMIL
jgi:selenocysteine-specific elongation factor